MKLRPRQNWLAVAAVALFFCFALGGGRAYAGPPDSGLEEALRAFNEAEKDYNLGRFAEAKKNYERAFEKKSEPALLYNIAQCERKLGDFDNAVFHYQRYLDKTPKAKNRTQVLALIEQSRKQAKEAADKRKQDEEAAAKNGPPGPSGPSGSSSEKPGTDVVASSSTTNPEKGPGETNPKPIAVVTPKPESNPSPSDHPTVPHDAITPPQQTQPPNPSTPVYKKWWLWTTVGVVIVGGAVGGVAAATMNPSHSTAEYESTSLGPIINAAP